MGESGLIFYIPPIVFTVVALAFFFLWRLKLATAWQWSAGFAQTAAGFVVSTFWPEPLFAAFASGMIFIGAAYCYGSGLLVHFDAPKLRIPRLAFVAVYTLILTYFVYGRPSLVAQLFLTDIGFALLVGWTICLTVTKASRPIDIALIVTSSIAVLDSVTRAVFFTFFTNSSDDFGDFANSLYNLEVSISTITICLFFPLSALAASASAAIERHRVAAETDDLTGLLNRRGFRDGFQKDSKSSSLCGSLVVCDIDHFKAVNDTFGHSMGDMVIRELAAELSRLIGPRGRVARYGGEEFAAFLPNASLEEAVALAELVRVSFAERAWRQLGLDRQVTISCGVALAAKGAATLDDIVDRADRALYAAKAAGRNNVMAEDAIVSGRKWAY